MHSPISSTKWSSPVPARTDAYNPTQEARILQATRCPVDGRLPVLWDVDAEYLYFICECTEAIAMAKHDAMRVIGGTPRSIPLRYRRGVLDYVKLVKTQAILGVPYTHVPAGPTLNDAVGAAQTKAILRLQQTREYLRYIDRAGEDRDEYASELAR